MSKRDDLIAKYADDLKNKCKMNPDMDLDESELETVKKNFLMKKLGLPDGDNLMAAINAVIDTYGRSERSKHRAVVYYMLTKHFGKEAVYNK